MDTQAAFVQAVNTVLEDPYWLPTLNTTDVYVRRQDDTDGKVGPEQEISVTFSPDGDAWLMLPGSESLRFRTDAGGGKSLRTRNALLLLAEAIRRDNEEHPQQ
ncbi:hypothetical protein [Duganella vulcania]|uniref:Uncharacterized protein n=1 Tax=Duganella vulcania TaxID=2692166 RepID=A0A845GIX4_9BURK|nr:hypothetical protein [Duganella vulcania]MYM92609.1 hypothetical protein [Duganella vulcania]